MTEDRSIFAQLPHLLKDWVPETASIAVATKQKYIVYRPGVHDLRITPGDAVRPGSIADRVFSQHDRVESDVDSSVFGIPYYGMGYPLRTELGVESALAIILPPKQRASRRPISFLMGHSDGVWRPIALEKVVYFESCQKKTCVRTELGSYTTDMTLQSLEDRLSSDRFLRVHRSYIVNISYIDFIRRDDHSNLVITLKTTPKTRVPVAQTYVRHVRNSLEF